MPVWAFEAIGTRWEIESEAPLSASARTVVTEVIERFDQQWSRFRTDSVVTRLAAEGGTAVLADAAPLLDAYAELSAATDGAVNPLVGESLAALGYDTAYSLSPGPPVPAPRDWTAEVQWSETELTLRRPALLDVGAVGKGRLVDLVLAALPNTPGTVVVDAGGDVAVRGAAASGAPVRIGLEHPYDPTRVIGVVEVRDGALCGSAINRRAWGNGLHHVLDGRTGLPVRTWAATWALAPDAMRADAVATALFFDGGTELAEEWGVEWVRMSTDGRVQRSPGWTAEIFTRSAG